jgi:2,3,4,5-tetrahydropyridine-2-carboxylate N-succinyltransferase
MQQQQQIIEQAFEDRAALQPGMAPAKVGEAVDWVLNQLDQGKLRVAEKIDGQWLTHQWIKKAVLLSFRLEENRVMEGAMTKYYDKVTPKFARYDAESFA